MKKFFLLFVFLLSMSVSKAAMPETISWQGILQDASGNNLDGQYAH